MKMLIAGAMLMAGCATTVPEEPGDIPVRGETGRKCSAAPAQGLVGRKATTQLGTEAVRLTGAATMRWIGEGDMVTMDYREDRLNIHLDAKNQVVKIACG